MSASEAERTLKGASDEIASGFIGKAEEIANEVGERAREITAVLSDRAAAACSTP